MCVFEPVTCACICVHECLWVMVVVCTSVSLDHDGCVCVETYMYVFMCVYPLRACLVPEEVRKCQVLLELELHVVVSPLGSRSRTWVLWNSKCSHS